MTTIGAKNKHDAIKFGEVYLMAGKYSAVYKYGLMKEQHLMLMGLSRICQS